VYLKFVRYNHKKWRRQHFCNCSFTNSISYIVAYVRLLLVLVYVIYTLTSVPDDDPRKGSKHVGLVYRDYIH
jgi:hypothetical protein